MRELISRDMPFFLEGEKFNKHIVATCSLSHSHQTQWISSSAWYTTSWNVKRSQFCDGTVKVLNCGFYGTGSTEAWSMIAASFTYLESQCVITRNPKRKGQLLPMIGPPVSLRKCKCGKWATGRILFLLSMIQKISVTEQSFSVRWACRKILSVIHFPHDQYKTIFERVESNLSFTNRVDKSASEAAV